MYPMNVFDEEAELDQETDRLIRCALLAAAGCTLEECRAWEKAREMGQYSRAVN